MCECKCSNCCSINMTVRTILHSSMLGYTDISTGCTNYAADSPTLNGWGIIPLHCSEMSTWSGQKIDMKYSVYWVHTPMKTVLQLNQFKND